MSDFIEVHPVPSPLGPGAGIRLLNLDWIACVSPLPTGGSMIFLSPQTAMSSFPVEESYEKIRRALWGG